MSAIDRLQELLAQTAVTGIDFVYVHTDQVTLDVYSCAIRLLLTFHL